MTEPAVPYIYAMDISGYFTVNAGSAGTAGSADRFSRNTFTASDRLTIVRGRHQISLGGEVSHLNDSLWFDTLESGLPGWGVLPPLPPTYPYYTFTSGNIMSDFVLGKPQVFLQRDGALARPRGNLYGLYGTDQIHVFPRFTLTLGMR